MDIAELLILAAALGVPPLVLLFPDLPDGEVEIIPGMPGNSWGAYLWAAGMVPSFLNPGPPSDGEQLIDAVRKRRELMLQLPAIQTEVRALTDHGDPICLESAPYRAAEVRDEISRLSAIIQGVGGVLKDAQTANEAGRARPDH